MVRISGDGLNATMRTLLRSIALPVGTMLLAVVLWQILTTSGFFTRDQFPTATDTLGQLGRLIADPDYWASILATLQAWFLGMVIATVLAVVIGCGLAASDFAARSAASVIEIFKAIPAIAILPLVILVLGSTREMKVFLIVFAVFWPLVIQVLYGVRSIDPLAIDTARSLGIGGPRRFFAVVLPGAAPFITTGLRIASASALILAVVSELVGGADGIGRNILQSQNGGAANYPTMYAYIITTGLMGLALTGLFLLLEARALRWHESRRNRRSSERGRA